MDFLASVGAQAGDVEAWSNAVICALQTDQAALAVILLHLSVTLAGLDAYDSLRTALASQSAHQILLAELDKLAMAADARPDAMTSEGVILRTLKGDDVSVIGERRD